MLTSNLQDAINNSLGLFGAGRFADMERYARGALSAFPDSPILCELVGIAMTSQYRHREALPYLEHAVRGDPSDPQFWENLGLCQLQLGQFTAAEASLRRALAIDPRAVPSLAALASVLTALGRAQEAQKVTEALLAIDPDFVRKEREWREQQLRNAIAVNPQSAELHDDLGLLLRLKGDAAGAEAHFRRAIALDARNPRVLVNLALLLTADRRDQEALTAAVAARDLIGEIDASTPPERVALFNLSAFALNQCGRCGDAVEMYRRVHRVHPDPAQALPMIQAARQACAWSFASEVEKQARRSAPGGLDVDRVGPGPLAMLASATALEQLAAAQFSARKIAQSVPAKLPRPPVRAARDRLRVSYFSRDLYNHACGILLVGVIEAHDRARFEIVAHDFAPPKADAHRRRLEAAFDRMIPIGQLSDRAAAERIAADDVDIVIDINGWTTGQRAAVLAQRPARLQVQWLGHPGTMGAPWIDYVIADRVIIPPGHEAHFSEKIIRLPHCYQPTDDKRAVGEPRSRADHGLPDGGFVFCSFNLAYKFTPEVFDVWMKLLAAVESSVLWLLEPSAAAVAALRQEAEARGVDPNRLIFAAKCASDEHLARLSHADLALDCFPYGSHTTASDMLWAGVPIVGLMGETFASRVSGSILTAGGLPELVTASLDDYHALALRLARDAAALAALKAKIAEGCKSSALFNTAQFARDLEQVLVAMSERNRAGLPPDHIAIE
jgi:predicted O-linked N-acetylglucosamine transferase (SPINDLY family)